MDKPQFGDAYMVRNTNIWSRLIRFWTRARFDHAGVVVWGGKGVEANTRGVSVIKLSEIKGQVVYLTPAVPLDAVQIKRLQRFLLEKLEEKAGYDWGAILGFIFFKRWQDPKKYFCYELVFDAYKAAGIEVARLDNDYVDGRTLYGSWIFKVRGGSR